MKTLESNNITPEELDAYLTKMESFVNKATELLDSGFSSYYIHKDEIDELMENYRVMRHALNYGYLLPYWKEI